MNGPGKYDGLCTYVREQAKARGVILIVIDGEHGNGFSAQLPPEVGGTIPAAMVAVAHEMAHDLRRQGVNVAMSDMEQRMRACHATAQQISDAWLATQPEGIRTAIQNIRSHTSLGKAG